MHEPHIQIWVSLKKVYEEWVGRTVTLDKMEQLQVSDVAPIYKKNYWNRVKGDQLPSGLDLCVFDFGVNAGTGRCCTPSIYKNGIPSGA